MNKNWTRYWTIQPKKLNIKNLTEHVQNTGGIEGLNLEFKALKVNITNIDANYI
jgi:hypothetical protein